MEASHEANAEFCIIYNSEEMKQIKAQRGKTYMSRLQILKTWEKWQTLRCAMKGFFSQKR